MLDNIYDLKRVLQPKTSPIPITYSLIDSIPTHQTYYSFIWTLLLRS